MIPILSTTGTLTGQGLGRLTEALSCIVTHEVNGEYELRMTYPVTGERYADIAENLVVWAEPDNLTPAQAFRIYRITRPLNGIVTIYARHIAYDMSGIVVKPFTASTLTNALAAISPNSSPSCPFTITSTRTVATQMKVSVPTVLWGLLGGQSGSFLDIYGGEWDFNNYTAELKTTLGTDRGVTVRYGKNLTKLEQDVTIEATYAGVFPYWYDEESGVLVKLTSDYISIPGATGSRLLLLDLSDEWETAPTEVQLQARANAYITANDPGTPKISWKVNMAMLSQSEEFKDMAILEQVMLGDTIHVYYEPMNLTASARAVKLEYDVLLERYTTVTLGRVKQNMAQIVAAEKKETAQNFKNLKSTLEKAIDSATDFITNPSGEMRFIYDANDVLQEIVVLDNPDISQAQSVWRLNSGGYGHSSTGYAGPYTLAITQNGAIVADFITAGTMAGNRVRTGLIEDETPTNYWDLDTGELHIEALSTLGCRNILLNSAKAHWGTLNGSTITHTEGQTVSEWLCNDAIRAAGNAGTVRIACQLYETSQTSNIYRADTKYTMSCYLKNNSTTKSIWLVANNGTSDEVGPGESKRAVVQVDGDGYTALRMRIYTPAAGDAFDFTYWHPQIEYGEIATDWQPAPEDKVGNNEIISKINVSTEGIVIQASKVDLAGYVTFTNLSTSGQTTINGTNITTGTIDASQVTVNNINASKITTGTITDANGYNSWNLTTGAFTITNGSINITTSTETYDVIELNSGDFSAAMSPSGLIVSLTDTYSNEYEFAYRAQGLGMWKNGTSYGYLTIGSPETTLRLGNSSANIGGNLEVHSTTTRILAFADSLQVQDLTNNLDRTILEYDTTNSTGRLTFNSSANSGTIRMELDNSGLSFYDSNGALTGKYSASGPYHLSAILNRGGGTRDIYFSGSTLAIIGAIGWAGGIYGMWSYSGYGAGTNRQRLNPILGPGSDLVATISTTGQSVSITNNNAQTNAGLYVWVFSGSIQYIV